MAGVSAILDVDRTARLVCQQIRRAGQRYRAGELYTEEPAMSHIVGHLRGSGQLLPIGLSGSPVRVHGRLAVLHRATLRKSDMFRSDLAVRIVGRTPAESKTAFIQIKMHDARKHRYVCPQDVGISWIDSRRFVASIGRRGFETFVVSAADLSTQIQSHMRNGMPNKSSLLDLRKTFAHCGLRDWVRSWLACTTGPTDESAFSSIADAFQTILSEGVIPNELQNEIGVGSQFERLPAIWIEYRVVSDDEKGPRRV